MISYVRLTLPGVALCFAVAAVAYALQAVEVILLSKAWVDAILIALVLGLATRQFFPLTASFRAGINFSAKQLLEFAVMLLGATISLSEIADSGAWLLSGIAMIVVTAILVSFLVSRLLGLSKRQSILIACGNSICGNSAIAAVATVIRAKPQETASAIAFTAVLGVAVVLLLPLAYYYGKLGEYEYGIVAGLTVYAVPQVLAATVPVGIASMQIAAVVKLVRVMMLGPVMVAVAFLHGSSEKDVKITKFIPWFLIGFLLLGSLRSLGGISDWTVDYVAEATKLLTIVAMAAMGLSIDVNDLRKSALRVTAAAMISLAILASISFAFVTLF